MSERRTIFEGPCIYNLFPLLAGRLPQWNPHLERARQMAFNWIFANPFQQPGASGSIYSIQDYYALNPELVDPNAGSPEKQLSGAVEAAHSLGMKVMMDLVINHTASDSPLIAEHPGWYKRDAAGAVMHPGAYDDERRWVSWDDLAAIDNADSPDRQDLWQYWLQLVLHYAALGFDGFRCDAAYQVPGELWRFLIESSRQRFPHLQYFAETLGCTPEQTLEVARSGFDFIFNSSKWWDLSAPWCLEQLRLTAPAVPSISFPESHDTERLAAELKGNIKAIRQRYVLAALFSSGVMMPIGFEYGFRRRLHVVKTRPHDWESLTWDDSEWIAWVNQLKAAHPVWNEDSPWQILETGSAQVVALLKSTDDGTQRALLLLNKSQTQEEPCGALDLSSLLGEHYALAAPQDSLTRLGPSDFRILFSLPGTTG